jgi:TRAP-type C4-dicarboxylate transport system permease small subunit
MSAAGQRATRLLLLIQRGLNGVNKLLMLVSMLAIVVTACILSYAVVTRYFFKTPTDWQDDVSVFILIGISFCCAAAVQAERGHIGIEALASLLPARVNRWRLWLVDLISFLFCTFFTWKSWTLFYEAWSEGQTTNSTFAPPLWIPYSLMAFGMTLLCLQLLLQCLLRLSNANTPAGRRAA